MKRTTNRALSFVIVLAIVVSLFAGMLTTSAASYTANWGKRGTLATSPSTKASSYYTGSYSYATLSSLSGSTSSSAADIYASPLGTALHNLSASKQTTTTSYDGTKSLYKYTDCENGNTNSISSFYSGDSIGPDWDRGDTWNREHTWPKSKGLGGRDEDDIMMLRPTANSENGSRGNTAYGESSGYYDPNRESNGTYNLHGDVARLMLQHMIRWGNTSLFGASGVIENKAVLLKWMQEDPVDTWEMGRNDAVQSITGVRNVFVDYPELAFLLLGVSVPENYSTPSNPTTPTEPTEPTTPTTPTTPTDPTEPTTSCSHTYVETKVGATCSQPGYTLHTCSKCGDYYRSDFTATLSHSFSGGICVNCGTADPDYVDPAPDIPYSDSALYASYADLEKEAWYRAGIVYVLHQGLMNGVGNEGEHIFDPDGKVTRAMVVTILYRAAGSPSAKGLALPFEDVETGSWYTSAVAWAADQGIVLGVSDTEFDPHSPITREQLAAVLYRYAGEPAALGNLTAYIDAKDVSQYALSALKWAIGEKIVTGIDNRLAPQETATRAQIATVFFRYLDPVAAKEAQELLENNPNPYD